MKQCVKCGTDCTGQPRVKDAAGRYYCRACYHAGADAIAPSMPVFTLPPTSIEALRGPDRSIPLAVRISGFLIAPRNAAMVATLSFVVVMLSSFANLSERLVTRKPETLAGLSWQMAFGIGLAGSILGGAVFWLVGGRWFHARLCWSGVEHVELSAGRGVYFFTVAPYALWGAAFTAALPLWYATPLDYRNEFRAVPDLVMLSGSLAMLVLGTIALFLLVWRGLGARFLPSLIWFLILPLIAYALQVAVGLALGFMIGISAAGSASPSFDGAAAHRSRDGETSRSNVLPGSGVPSAPGRVGPDLKSAQRFKATEQAPYTFKYPGNWTVTKIEPDEGNPFSSTRAEGPDGSLITIALLDRAGVTTSPTMILDDAVIELRSRRVVLDQTLPLASVGKFNGDGRWLMGDDNGERVAIKMLVVSGLKSSLLLITQSPVPDPVFGHRGVDMVLESLEVSSLP